MKKIGFYVHIPFCVRKCAYCDFLSFEGKSDKQGPYIGALNREVDIIIEKMGIGENESFEVASIYLVEERLLLLRNLTSVICYVN